MLGDRECLVNLVGFRDFLKPLSCLLLELIQFLAGWNALPPAGSSCVFTNLPSRWRVFILKAIATQSLI